MQRSRRTQVFDTSFFFVIAVFLFYSTLFSLRTQRTLRAILNHPLTRLFRKLQVKEDEYMKKLILIITALVLTLSAFSQKRIAQPKSKEEILNETYCSGLFNTRDAVYFDFTDPTINTSAMGHFNVLDWLQGRVAGLQIYTTRTNLRIPYIRNQRAGVYVNEMWVGYDYLTMLPVADIAMIKVIKGPFAPSFGGPGGAIAIYTLQGDEETEDTE